MGHLDTVLQDTLPAILVVEFVRDSSEVLPGLLFDLRSSVMVHWVAAYRGS